VQAGLDRLRQNPTVASEMGEMAEEDAQERKAGEDLRRLIERLAKEGVAGLRACAGMLAEQSLLDEAESETVRRLVAEHLEDVPVIVPHRGSKAPKISLRKPLEDTESRQEYVGRPSASVEAMRAALVFRPARPQHDQKLRRSGEMDDEELWRVGTGDFRVFSERVIEARPDTALGMLVDISGSMAGRKLAEAQRLAQVLLLAAMDSEGVTPYVWAHTGDLMENSTAEVYTIFEPGDPATRLGLLGSLDNGDNYDGAAIALCADRLRAMEQEQKVLLVLSDGYPAGTHYGGAEAQRHMREVCRWAASQGVTVIQIAIDSELRAADQAAMFGEGQFVMFRDDRQVARDLTAILSRYAR
jgi:Mg-chelatase subunit ChlD